MHWLSAAAARAGIKGAEDLVIDPALSLGDVWEVASRTLSLAQQDLAGALAVGLGLTEADFEHSQPAALAFLPERIARRYHVFPLREDGRYVVIATADPGNIQAEHSIGFATGRRLILELATPSAIDEAILAGYGGERAVDQLLSNIDEQIADTVRVVEELSPETVDQAEADAAPVVKLTNLILRDAVALGASDVHIEPGVKSGVVRFRVDGVLRRYMYLPMRVFHRVVSRIKVLANLDIADRIRPQDGRSRVTVDGKYVDLRISTVCTRDAEKAVVRILRPENTRRLDAIGIMPHELARLRQLINCRDGIVIVTGPTGSGKTTTLYAAIRAIGTGEINVSTVEDPVEYELPGITQIQVDPKRGVTFAGSLRALLRQDPDVIFVGEIRDSETAQIAAQAAMTGHLVLATLHTNDAMSAVARLLDLGLDRQTIAATLRGTVAQRLMRRVCADCAQPIAGSLTEEEEALSARYGVRPSLRAAGCKHCGNTGYRGRLPLIEVAVITPSLAELIVGGASAHALGRAAISQGMVPMREVGTARIIRGETTLQELERVVGDVIEDRPVQRTGGTAVLVVNADPAWRSMARALLEHDDVRVIEVMDAAEAMRLMASGGQFALVLTDAMMPAAPVGELSTKPASEGSLADWSPLAPALPLPVGRVQH